MVEHRPERLHNGRGRTVQSPEAEVQPFEELWDPALLIGELWLEPRAGTQVIGREAILVGGSPRPTERPSGTYPAL